MKVPLRLPQLPCFSQATTFPALDSINQSPSPQRSDDDSSGSLMKERLRSLPVKGWSWKERRDGLPARSEGLVKQRIGPATWWHMPGRRAPHHRREASLFTPSDPRIPALGPERPLSDFVVQGFRAMLRRRDSDSLTVAVRVRPLLERFGAPWRSEIQLIAGLGKRMTVWPVIAKETRAESTADCQRQSS